MEPFEQRPVWDYLEIKFTKVIWIVDCIFLFLLLK